MIWDGARLRIPHSVCLVILVLMPVWGLLQPDGVPWLSHLLGFAITFVVGFVLWRLRWFGGGDVKFLSVIALWFGVRDLGIFLATVSLLGAALAILLVALRAAYGMLSHRSGDGATRNIPLLQKGDPVPYGIAIGLARFSCVTGCSISADLPRNRGCPACRAIAAGGGDSGGCSGITRAIGSMALLPRAHAARPGGDRLAGAR